MALKMHVCSFGHCAGRKYGITDLGPDVINFVSHATQQRLQNLLEKVSEVAQQKNISYKVSHHNTNNTVTQCCCLNVKGQRESIEIK